MFGRKADRIASLERELDRFTQLFKTTEGMIQELQKEKRQLWDRLMARNLRDFTENILPEDLPPTATVERKYNPIEDENNAGEIIHFGEGLTRGLEDGEE